MLILSGHLFDSQVINKAGLSGTCLLTTSSFSSLNPFPCSFSVLSASAQVLDLLEGTPVTCEVLKAELGKNTSTPSRMTIMLYAPSNLALQVRCLPIFLLSPQHSTANLSLFPSFFVVALSPFLPRSLVCVQDILSRILVIAAANRVEVTGGASLCSVSLLSRAHPSSLPPP